MCEPDQTGWFCFHNNLSDQLSPRQDSVDAVKFLLSFRNVAANPIIPSDDVQNVNQLSSSKIYSQCSNQNIKDIINPRKEFKKTHPFADFIGDSDIIDRNKIVMDALMATDRSRFSADPIINQDVSLGKQKNHSGHVSTIKKYMQYVGYKEPPRELNRETEIVPLDQLRPDPYLAAVSPITGSGKRARKLLRRQRRIGVSYADLLVPCPRDSLSPYNPSKLLQIFLHSQLPSTRGCHIWGKSVKEPEHDWIPQTHPSLHPSLTLNILRTLKVKLFAILEKCTLLEVSTLATAWVYLERLAIQQVLTKVNHKYLAASCVMLAYKFNQEVGSAQSQELAWNIQKIDLKDGLSVEDIFRAEFFVFRSLGFSLQLSESHIKRHFQEFNERIRESNGDSNQG